MVQKNYDCSLLVQTLLYIQSMNILLLRIIFEMLRNDTQSAKQSDSSPYFKMESAPQSGNTTNLDNSQQILSPSSFFEDSILSRSNSRSSDTKELERKQFAYHAKAFFATLILIGGLAFGIVIYFFSDTKLSILGLLGIWFGSYVLYLIVAFCLNPLSNYLKNISVGQTFQKYNESLRSSRGHFTFNVQCYHFETKDTMKTVRDSYGNMRQQRETVTEKVVTHVASQILHPVETKDESRSIDQIFGTTKIIFAQYFANYKFTDSQSQRKFTDTFQSFKYKHNKDVHQDFSYKFELPGLIRKKSYFVGQLNCDFYFWYYGLGAIGLIWPYSLWTESRISRFRVYTMKVLKL